MNVASKKEKKLEQQNNVKKTCRWPKDLYSYTKVINSSQMFFFSVVLNLQKYVQPNILEPAESGYYVHAKLKQNDFLANIFASEEYFQ